MDGNGYFQHVFKHSAIHISKIPQEIIDEYNLMNLIEPDSYVYIEIRRAMYGLRQSGRLANNALEKVLGAQGYYPSKYTPGLYLHKTRPISFTLVVDDFGVKYVNKEDARTFLVIRRPSPKEN